MIENTEFQSHYRTARSVVARLRFARWFLFGNSPLRRSVPARRFLVLISLPSAGGRRNAAALQMQMDQLAETPLVRRAQERL
jgi:hypothetical protein